MTSILPCLLTLLVLAGIAWWALESPFFAVERIASGAYRFTTAEELEAAFGEFLGRNIWTVDTDAVAARIGDLPWVRDVRVVRRLPDGLEVEFREWSPRLLLAPHVLDGVREENLVLVQDGRVLPFPAALVAPALPVLVGVSPVRAGSAGPWRLDEADAARVAELVSAMEDAGLEAVSPVDFVVVEPEGYAIVLQDEQGKLLVGREEFGPRLQRWMTARDHLEPGLDYDLRFKDRITVRPHR